MVVKRQHLTHLVGPGSSFLGRGSEGREEGADSMFFIHLFPNWGCHNFFYGGHGEFSSCQEFFSSRSRYICTAVPEMKAVISADIILERRNTVVYYSPLIKAVRLSICPAPLISPLLRLPVFTRSPLHAVPSLTSSTTPLTCFFFCCFRLFLPLSSFCLCGLINGRPGTSADLERSALWEGLG